VFVVGTRQRVKSSEGLVNERNRLLTTVTHPRSPAEVDAPLAVMTEKNIRLIVPYLIYLLPSLHLGACVAMWLSEYRNLEPMILIDFPFSVLAVGAAYQGVNPWIILGIVGTLWWYFISRFIRWIVIGVSTGSWKH
jgi:hypothetical protein